MARLHFLYNPWMIDGDSAKILGGQGTARLNGDALGVAVCGPDADAGLAEALAAARSG
jgi:hypothetical protein